MRRSVCMAAAAVAAWAGGSLLAGCAEERTLISRDRVVEGVGTYQSSGARSLAETAAERERPKYREHWWQFWREPMPEAQRIAREQQARAIRPGPTRRVAPGERQPDGEP